MMPLEAPQSKTQSVGPFLLKPPRVVALGGGTGLPVLLQGLKAELFPSWAELPEGERDRLTAIVTVADDGGSSGRLRRCYDVPPAGDIRNCLLALADAGTTLTDLFDYRFNDGDVAGHSLGNLILAALSRMEMPFTRAVERAGDLLAIRGRVLPASLEAVTLRAEFHDGSSVEGESRIAGLGRSIARIRLNPQRVRAVREARTAIEAADLVVIGPGSLFTSLIPVLLVPELAKALSKTHAHIVLVMNLMTEPGETDGFTAADHLRAVKRHVPKVPIHDVLINDAPIPPDWVEAYSHGGAQPIVVDEVGLRSLGVRAAWRNLVAGGPKIRHDAGKLARAVLELSWDLAKAVGR
jgi:uncharacterized cofD-like protein